MLPQAGGPKASALGAAMKKRSTGGWRNAKEAISSTSGATNRSTVGPFAGVSSEYGGGGRTVNAAFRGGSLSMPGVVMVKRPTAGPTHFATAQPAGRAAKKYPKMKAPGK
jgi:hypothetical protein